jgi:4-oxalocrotonate tautomerase
VNWHAGIGAWETPGHAAGTLRRVNPQLQNEEDLNMPLVDIELIEGVFSKHQKQEMIHKITDAMVAIEGEAMRGLTWVRVHEVPSGNWGIGGKGVTTADVKAMQNRAA